jgi:hypothetical protein
MKSPFKKLLKDCKKIDYKDVIELGFERESAADGIWLNKFGYEYFIVHKRISKSIQFDWDIKLRKVQIITLDEKQNILNRFPVKNLSTLIDLIDFFKTSEINKPQILC